MGRTKAQLQQDNKELRKALQDTDQELVAVRSNHTDLTYALRRLIAFFTERAEMLHRVGTRPDRPVHTAVHESKGIGQVLYHLGWAISSPNNPIHTPLGANQEGCSLCSGPILVWQQHSNSKWFCSCGCAVGWGASAHQAQQHRTVRAQKRFHDKTNGASDAEVLRREAREAAMQEVDAELISLKAELRAQEETVRKLNAKIVATRTSNDAALQQLNEHKDALEEAAGALEKAINNQEGLERAIEAVVPSTLEPDQNPIARLNAYVRTLQENVSNVAAEVQLVVPPSTKVIVTTQQGDV